MLTNSLDDLPLLISGLSVFAFEYFFILGITTYFEDKENIGKLYTLFVF